MIVLAAFAMGLYGKPLTFSSMLVIVIASLAYVMSTVSMDGSVAATMLYIVLDPLGLPSDIILFIQLSTFMLYAGISTFVAMYANIAVTSLLCPKASKSQEGKSAKTHFMKPSNDKMLISASK